LAVNTSFSFRIQIDVRWYQHNDPRSAQENTQEIIMAEAKATEASNWPDLAMALWDGLTGRKAEIAYHFDHLEVSLPSHVGDGAQYATWKLNGVLKIRTSDKTQA
jgi:hypothetical protein